MNPLALQDLQRFDTYSQTAQFRKGILPALMSHHMAFPKFESTASYRLKSIPYSSQEKSGYCWLIAALNCLSIYASKKYSVDACDVKFSKNYLIFWDKIEKSNWFLERMLELRDSSLNSNEVQYLLRRGMSDRGQWNMAKNLIVKYGLIPYEIMLDSNSSKNTGELNACLNILLRNDAYLLRTMHKKGADVAELRLEKEQMLSEIIAIIVSCFGNPEQIISLPSYISKAHHEKLNPLEFYQRYISFPFDTYINICNDGKDRNKQFICEYVELDGNVVGGSYNIFMHIGEDLFYETVVKQVEQEGFCWFGCDAGKFCFWEQGVYDDSVFNFSTFSPSMKALPPKAVINQYLIAGMSHAMILLNHVPFSGQRWWMALDSSATSNKNNGICWLSDSWFRKFVYQATVKKQYLSLPPKLKSLPIKNINPWEMFSPSVFP